MKDFADGASIYQLLGKSYGGHAAVVVANHMDDAVALNRLKHPPGFGYAICQRFLTKHNFLFFSGSYCGCCMSVARGADVNNVNVLSRTHRFPGGGPVLPPKSLGSLLNLLLITSADNFHYRLKGR